MLFFEVEGVRRQETARTIEQANRCYEHSCELCCIKGLPLKCKFCAIEQAHDEAVRRLESLTHGCFDVPARRGTVVTKVLIAL